MCYYSQVYVHLYLFLQLGGIRCFLFEITLFNLFYHWMGHMRHVNKFVKYKSLNIILYGMKVQLYTIEQTKSLVVALTWAFALIIKLSVNFNVALSIPSDMRASCGHQPENESFECSQNRTAIIEPFKQKLDEAKINSARIIMQSTFYT